MATAQPNIVIIMADFMSALALPMYGNTTIRAPHMRRLGEEGIVFENAYCNAPLCAPSRASLLTGLLPSKVGVYDNGSELPASIPTFAHYLRLAGYRTILSGKMHFVGPDQLHGFEERLTSDVVPSDFGWSPQPGGAPWSYGRGDDDEFPDYPNLDEVIAAGPCIRSLGIDYDDEVTFTSVNKIYQMAREEADQPFLMTVSFIQPHPPFASPAEYWNRYDDGDVPMPSVAPIPVDEYDPVSRHLYEFSAMGRTDLSDDHVRRARHAYFAMLSHIDDRVGQILAALEATRFAPNTVVVISADHGNMLGERGLWGLRTFFEWAERVPLVFHCPDAFAAARVNTPVSLVDLLPTLVDLAGGEADSLPNPVDGRSLTGHLCGRGDSQEHNVLAEYCGEGVPAPWLMIRRGRYKLVHCEQSAPLLFDLHQDPEERIDLAQDPAHASTQDELQQEILKQWDAASLPALIAESVQRRATIFEANSRGRPPVWDHAVDNDPYRSWQRSYREAWQKTEERALLR